MTMPLPEPAPVVSAAVEVTAAAVAGAVADVAESTMETLRSENNSLRSRVSTLEFENTRLASELAEAKKEPEITVVTVVEEPTIIEGDAVVSAPVVPVENSPVEPAGEESVTEVESSTVGPGTTESTTDEKPKKAKRRGAFGRR